MSSIFGKGQDTFDESEYGKFTRYYPTYVKLYDMVNRDYQAFSRDGPTFNLENAEKTLLLHLQTTRTTMSQFDRYFEINILTSLGLNAGRQSKYEVCYKLLQEASDLIHAVMLNPTSVELRLSKEDPTERREALEKGLSRINEIQRLYTPCASKDDLPR